MAVPTQAFRLARWHALAASAWPDAPVPPRRTPVSQLIKSLISSRTRDAVSLAAHRGLSRRFGSAAAIAAASPHEVEAVIATVTFADVKAERLVAALARVGAERPDFDLAFLGAMTMADALAWLERLPGVGRKTSASVLNFSTLSRPIMVVDAHVLRVLARLGLPVTTAEGASIAVTDAMPDWSAETFRAFHARLKRLGQTLCRWDAPHCAACPLAPACTTARGAVLSVGMREQASLRLPF